MKPITDDVVFSIMERLETRERKQKAAREAAISQRMRGASGNRRIVSLDIARQRARRTVSGMLCYVAR